MARRKKKGKSKKKIVLVSLLGGALALVVTVYLLATTYLTRNYLTEQIENALNCRFEMGELNVSVFSPTATLLMSDVRVAPRDSFANDGTMHDERPKLDYSKVDVGNLKVEISLFDLLFRNLDVKSITIEGARVDLILKKDGTNDLEPLIASPKDRDDKDKGNTFNALTNADIVAHLRHFKLIDAEFNVVVESSKLEIQAKHVNVKLLDELRVDVSDLANMTPARFGFAAEINMFSERQELHYGMVGLDGDIEGLLFDSLTGDFDPKVELELEIDEKSHLKKLPVLQKLSDALLGIENLPFVDKDKLKAWPETYVFTEGKSLHCSFHQNTYSFMAPLTLNVGQWSLQLQTGSNFTTKDSSHVFLYKLLASPAISRMVDTSLNAMTKVLPAKAKALALAEVKHLVYDGDRFALQFRTTGSLSNPDVQLVSTLPNIGRIKKTLLDSLKGDLKDGLLDLLK